MGPREVPWPKAAAEGCEVLKPSKAAAEVLRVLRPAQNVPNRNSLWGLGRYHGRKLLRRVRRFWGFEGLPKTCHVAVSKPNRNSLWGLGRYHGKASGTPGCYEMQSAAWGHKTLMLSRRATKCILCKKLNASGYLRWHISIHMFLACIWTVCQILDFFRYLIFFRPAQNVPRSSFEAQ